MDLVKKFNTILSDIDAALFRDKKFIKFASIVKGAAGSMWVCTENNLCEVDTNLTIRVIPSPFLERPRHLTKGKNGLIWGTLRQNIGYFKFDPKKEKVRIYFNYFDKEVMQAIGLSGILGEEYIISNDVKNNIIGFTESSKLLFNLDIEDASIKPFKRGISSSFIGTRLLHLLDPYINEKSTESFNPWCNGILFEAGNQVWVATIRGLFLLKNNNAIRIKKETQLAGLSLRAIYQVNEEEVYIGSYMGLYKWNLTTNKLQIIDPDIFICSFSPYKGDTLLMTSDPNILYLLNKKTDEVSRYQFTNEKEYPSYKIFSILKDDKDALWLGNFKVDIRANQPDSLSFIRDCNGKAIFKEEIVYVIKKSNIGGIWLGTNTGLYKKDSCTITYYNLLDKEASAFSQVAINDLYEKNDSTVVIGTKYKGLYIFNPQKQTFKLINESNGLSDNRVCSIVLGNDNDYWVSTFHGLNHLSSDNKVVSIYYEKDGLADNEFNTYSSCKFSNGDIFFGGIAGGTILQKNKDTISNKVHEFDKLFGYKKINSATNKFEEFYFYFPNPSVTLHADEHYIEFFLKNTYAKDKVAYSYFLKGFDTGWINNNNNSEAIRYTNLDAGQYTFFIRSVDKSGARKVVSAQLLVKQYFYESAWFKAAVTLGLLSLLYLINYYRF